MHRANFTASIPNLAAAREAAAAIGCVQTRGAGKGQGSIREMLIDIGAGEVLVHYTHLDDPGHMRATAAALRALVAGLHSGDDARQTVEACAVALDRAATLRSSAE